MSGRWACESLDGPAKPLTKKEFLEAWGEPDEKISTETGETWIYQENGKWCGVWILPIPLMLPVCKTRDEVIFEGDVAVRSNSRRLTRSVAALVVVPMAPVPVPLVNRSGKKTDGVDTIRLFDGDGAGEDTGCRPQKPAEVPAEARQAVSEKAIQLAGMACVGSQMDIDGLEQLGNHFLEAQMYQEAMACYLEVYQRDEQTLARKEVYQRLGLMHEIGLGVAVDMEAAMRWYRLGGL